jgi:molybdopterin synthase sulfur carrier subunit
MKIHVYAALKDYFQPEFEVRELVTNTDELKAVLLTLNDKAGDILSSCRFAVEEGFIDNAFKLNQYDTVVIIPPASGG